MLKLKLECHYNKWSSPYIMKDKSLYNIYLFIFEQASQRNVLRQMKAAMV